MRRLLFLDDDPERCRKVQQAAPYADIFHTAFGAISALFVSDYEIVSLDHDLGSQTMVDSGPGTGYEVACFIAKSKRPKLVVLHSFNRVGVQNMARVLISSGVTTAIGAFGTDVFKALVLGDDNP